MVIGITLVYLVLAMFIGSRIVWSNMATVKFDIAIKCYKIWDKDADTTEMYRAVPNPVQLAFKHLWTFNPKKVLNNEALWDKLEHFYRTA